MGNQTIQILHSVVWATKQVKYYIQWYGQPNKSNITLSSMGNQTSRILHSVVWATKQVKYYIQ